ncbi:4-hydroxy-tetrahydrodipicolinate reductase [Magnetospirillum molischianum]|uniref:4-hydroxy-tetrahydrodipicolinate reductase n=1 Tax=Magnetospirillum molischianum DSM 120 TaxID=1150626 RepID=H8FTH3_MAGML|nr:4-hydroxy-tetrahydrodipicolinate reductase [Magnetospirillum molischianum]CCG41661.1 Dihydrodipicolinate reductase (DHPR) [Magnetospirillum molischianum DSM 120]
MKIGICGCAGRMGRMLMESVLNTDGCDLSGGSERSGAPIIGRDLGTLIGREALDLAATDDIAALFDASDALIDFTAPAATVAHAAMAAERGKILVVGTTGLTPEDEQALAAAARRTVIVHAPNYSVGVTLLTALTERAAQVLGEDFDIEIVEMHHRHKVDAPSGTALGLGRAAAAGRAVALDQVWCKSRDGHTGARPRGEIGFATLRGGDVVGDHSVIFAAEGERVELTHKASSRAIFARGAVRAALWAQGRTPGLYTMRDVLGL